MVHCTRDFLYLSLDGSLDVEDKLQEGESVTVASQLDHYCARPATPEFEGMTLLQFVQRYKTPKKVGGDQEERCDCHCLPLLLP